MSVDDLNPLRLPLSTVVPAEPIDERGQQLVRGKTCRELDAAITGASKDRGDQPW